MAPRFDFYLFGFSTKRFVRFSVKNKFSLALAALIISALVLPAFVFGQQKHDQSNSSTGTTTGKTGVTSGSARRPRVRSSSDTTGAVAQDFEEALSVIQAHY